MISVNRLAVLALLISAGLVGAANNDKKDPKKDDKLKNPNEVEVRLVDGSKVRMKVMQDQIDVETKFGKLSVPATSIRRVDFGLHLSTETQTKLDKAIKDLADDKPDVRKQAFDDLVGLGALGYRAVIRASKSTDSEVARAAKGILEKIREKVSEEQLNIKDEDTVHTDQFTIVGKVLTTTIKAKTDIFGDSELKLTDLRSIRWMNRFGEVEVAMDGAKIIPKPQQWVESGVEVEAGDEIEIVATGKIDLYSNYVQQGGQAGYYEVGPEGTPNNINQPLQGQAPAGFPPGALIGRIGDKGDAFQIGEKFKTVVKREGKLYLNLGQSHWWNNGSGVTVSGAFKVKITGGRTN